VLYAYSKQNFWSRLQGSPQRVRRLSTLVEDTLEAVWQNGYDPAKVVKLGATLARRRLYVEFFEELNANPANPNQAKLEEIARQDRRIDGKWQYLLQSVKKKFAEKRRSANPKQLQAAREAWNAAVQEGSYE